MRMRGPERAAVAAVLEMEYGDADEAAQAVWDAVVALLRARDSYGVAVCMDGVQLAHGPYWDLTSAKKAQRALAGLPAPIAPLFAPTRLDEPDETPGNSCPDCHHPKFAHFDRGKKAGCTVPRCPCRNMYPE